LLSTASDALPAPADGVADVVGVPGKDIENAIELKIRKWKVEFKKNR
jgi:hypothetical protein